MSREIIGDDMNFLCRGLASNEPLEKSHELRASMAGRGSAEDFTTLGVERRKERKRPVPIIFKPCRSARPGLKGNTGSNWRDPSEWTGLNCSSASF